MCRPANRLSGFESSFLGLTSRVYPLIKKLLNEKTCIDVIMFGEQPGTRLILAASLYTHTVAQCTGVHEAFHPNSMCPLAICGDAKLNNQSRARGASVRTLAGLPGRTNQLDRLNLLLVWVELLLMSLTTLHLSERGSMNLVSFFYQRGRRKDHVDVL